MAAVAIDGRKLNIIGEYKTDIQPIWDEKQCEKLGVQPFTNEITNITGIRKEQLEKAPVTKVAWLQFVEFVNKFNYKKSRWESPIPVGFNSTKYDSTIISRLAKEYGPWDKEYNSEALFHPIHQVDIMNWSFLFFENNIDMKSLSMDSHRTYMGMESAQAHSALFDSKQTAQLLIKYLGLIRKISPKVKFKGSFIKNETDA